MMGNENQSMQMLNNYENYNNPGRANYIVVFTVLQIQQSSSGTGYTASPSGYGDEGKWEWMASISGAAEQWYLTHGVDSTDYMSATTSTVWKDQSIFGTVSNTTGQFVWNDQGENCTINELMNNAWNAILQLLECCRNHHYTANYHNFKANILLISRVSRRNYVAIRIRRISTVSSHIQNQLPSILQRNGHNRHRLKMQNSREATSVSKGSRSA